MDWTPLHGVFEGYFHKKKKKKKKDFGLLLVKLPFYGYFHVMFSNVGIIVSNIQRPNIKYVRMTGLRVSFGSRLKKEKKRKRYYKNTK